MRTQPLHIQGYSPWQDAFLAWEATNGGDGLLSARKAILFAQSHEEANGPLTVHTAPKLKSALCDLYRWQKAILENDANMLHSRSRPVPVAALSKLSDPDENKALLALVQRVQTGHAQRQRELFEDPLRDLPELEVVAEEKIIAMARSCIEKGTGMCAARVLCCCAAGGTASRGHWCGFCFLLTACIASHSHHSKGQPRRCALPAQPATWHTLRERPRPAVH